MGDIPHRGLLGQGVVGIFTNIVRLCSQTMEALSSLQGFYFQEYPSPCVLSAVDVMTNQSDNLS